MGYFIALEGDVFNSQQTPVQKITRLLINFRISNYSTFPILPDDLLSEMIRLAQTLTKKILTIQKPKEDIENLMQRYQTRLNAVSIDGVPEHLALHAAQLLQYFTILCAPVTLSELDTSGLVDFLNKNEVHFGSTAKNVFLIEYQTTKIYNELWHYHDALLHKLAPVEKVGFKLELLQKRITELAATVAELKGTFKDDVFCEYLHFSLQYTSALFVKVDYLLKQRDLIDDEVIQHEFAQKMYLSSACESLRVIENREKEAELEHTFVAGEIFFLGQCFSKKYSPDQIQLNIQSILKP